MAAKWARQYQALNLLTPDAGYALRKVQTKLRFISFEPLINEVKNIDLSGINWAIVGGESGSGARKMKPEWVYSIKNECDRQNVLFYF